MQAQLILILLVALVLILVTLQNPNPVSVQFLSWEARQVPMIIIMLISLLLGVIVSSVLGLLKRSKLKEKIRHLESEIEELRHPSAASHDEHLED